MLDKIKKLIKDFNIDYYEIRIQENKLTKISLIKNKVDEINEVIDNGGSIRLFYNGCWNFISFNSFDELKNKINSLFIEKFKYFQKQKKININLLKPIKAKQENKVKVDFEKIKLDDKLFNCFKYSKILNKNKKLISSSVLYADALRYEYLITSEEVEIETKIKFCGIYFSGTAKDGMNVQTAYHSTGNLEGYQIVLNLEKEVEDVIKRTIELIKAKPVEPGIYTVIIDPKLCGVFTHEAFGHLNEADFIYENPQFKKVLKLGKRLANDIVTIIDDPTLEGLAGHYLFDSEGTPAQKTFLLKNGILTGRLHSKETAVKMKEKVTGNARSISYHFPPIVRMSNTYLAQGPHKFEEVLSETKNGIYAIGSLGGMTNTEMFTFSAEEAYLIKDGKLTEKIRDVVLSGNVFSTLLNIDRVCDDLKFSGGLGGCGKAGQSPLRVSDGGPHIRIKNVTIGGK